jgi:hypothetical protein
MARTTRGERPTGSEDSRLKGAGWPCSQQDKELLITARLFGSLIQYGLVVSLTLGIALRYVLDALRKPPGSKMFTFGIEALGQFQSRLPEWPQYCSYILQVATPPSPLSLHALAHRVSRPTACIQHPAYQQARWHGLTRASRTARGGC